MTEKDIYAFNENIFRIVGKDSALLTAGTLSSFNSMTISWATMGVLWGKNVLICFVRPSRYTYGFMENHDVFSVSFFVDSFKKELDYMGTHSGRNTDKVKACNFTPVSHQDGCVYYEEARLTFILKKIYYQDLDSTHIPEEILTRNYATGNFHRVYVGEIIGCLEKEQTVS